MVAKKKKAQKKSKEPKVKAKKVMHKKAEHKAHKVEHKHKVHKQEHKTKAFGITGFVLSLLALVFGILLFTPLASISVAENSFDSVGNYLFLGFLISVVLSLLFNVIQAFIKPNKYSRYGTLLSSLLAILFILLILFM